MSDEYFRQHFREVKGQREGTKYFWLALENGIRLKYGTAPNGHSAIMSANFPKDDFGPREVKAWLEDRDEAQIALEAGVKGDVFVRLTESFQGIGAGDKPPVVDRSANVIRSSLICGWESVNGRSYRPVLRRATPMYDGRFVSLNHPEPGKAVAVESRFGQYRAPSLDEQYGVRGDLHYNPKHPAAEQLLWFAENMPGAVCNSHRVNAVGRRNRETGKFDITDIDTVFGVELVADGGTTRGMFEHADGGLEEGTLDDPAAPGRKAQIVVPDLEAARRPQPEPETSDMDMKDLKIEDLRSQRPDLVEKVVEALKAEDEYKALVRERDGLKTEVTTLKEKLDAFEAAGKLAERKAAMQKRCEDAKLPGDLVTETFLDALLRVKEDDEEAIKAMIEDRAKLAGRVATTPKSRSRTAAEAAGDKDRKAGSKPEQSDVTVENFVESVTV